MQSKDAGVPMDDLVAEAEDAEADKEAGHWGEALRSRAVAANFMVSTSQMSIVLSPHNNGVLCKTMDEVVSVTLKADDSCIKRAMLGVAALESAGNKLVISTLVVPQALLVQTTMTLPMPQWQWRSWRAQWSRLWTRCLQGPKGGADIGC